MDVVKKVPLDDLPDLADINIRAYPAFFGEDFTEERKEKMIEGMGKIQTEVDSIEYWGLYRDGKLLGGMRIHYFQMNTFGKIIQVGGVGMVAVHFLHKKEKVAKGLLEFFHQHFQDKGSSMTVLYPFRADFYKQMGYGYGTKMNNYYFKPDSTISGPSKANIVDLGAEDLADLLACYNKYAQDHHGLIMREERDFKRYTMNHRINVIGVRHNGQLDGYIIFGFKKAKEDNFLVNDMEVYEIVYHTPQALGEILSFINSQADQIHRVKYPTQDENFHYVLKDARNKSDNIFYTSQETNTQGRGIMYRLLDCKKFFEEVAHHNFGGVTIKVKFIVEDSFLPRNAGSLCLAFEGGKVTNLEDSGEVDVEVRCDISDLSSVVLGVIPLNQLYKFGLVEVSDFSKVESLTRLFWTGNKPWCMTEF